MLVWNTQTKGGTILNTQPPLSESREGAWKAEVQLQKAGGCCSTGSGDTNSCINWCIHSLVFQSHVCPLLKVKCCITFLELSKNPAKFLMRAYCCRCGKQVHLRGSAGCPCWDIPASVPFEIWSPCALGNYSPDILSISFYLVPSQNCVCRSCITHHQKKKGRKMVCLISWI